MGAMERRLLIVDDEPAVCQSLKSFFGSRGFAVETAFSGEEALVRLKRGPVEVILIDILLPGIHGIEVLRQAKALYPSARAVMMTGLEQGELQQEAIRSGASSFVLKPMDLGDASWANLLDGVL